MGAISEGLRTWLLGTLHLLPGLVLGFVVHEACHALAAVKLGDPTPAREGRLTLDPTAHIDRMGLITYLLLGWGYARPVRITVGNIRHGKWGEALVALAGPLSNLVLGAVFYAWWGFVPQGLWSGFLLSGCCSNLTLCVLNLVPVAPLDGFELLKLLMKNRGFVISRDVIMERVWDTNYEGESRTIDVHVRSIRQKLGEAGAMIKTIRNVGYMADA